METAAKFRPDDSGQGTKDCHAGVSAVGPALPGLGHSVGSLVNCLTH